MDRIFDTKYVFRVWYTENGKDRDACFTDGLKAKWFAEKVQESGATNVYVSKWVLEMKIERLM